jgi:glycosyltransferase involved in cell wall biosynthesis
MRNVAIYRHQLFKRSEPFIAEQAKHLVGVSPLLIGRERLGPGHSSLKSVALADFWPKGSLLRRVNHAVTMNPEPVTRLLRDSGTELIHAHFGVDAVYAERVSSRMSVPLVTTFHGFDATASVRAHLHSRSPARMNYLLRRKVLARRGDVFLCVSEFIRGKVLQLGFPEARTRVHYIGVDTDGITPGLKSPVPLILHVGRHVEVKGVDTLLKAFASLAGRHPEAELHLVGDGPLQSSLRSMANWLGLGHRVRFLGARSHAEVVEMMRRAWVLCLPSNTTQAGETEGFGIVLLEAAAAGIPVVASRHGGIPEAVLDGVTGLLSDERDANALADHLCTLVGSASLRDQLGSAARSRVETQFNLAQQSAVLSEIYRGLL